MGVMLIIARIDWLTCKRKGCGWCFSSSTRWCVSRPAWFKTADRTWSVSVAEVRRELKKRMSGWAVVTNDEACRALPEMKDLCIAIQYTPGVCCFLWVPVVIYTPFFFDDVRCLQHSQFGLELMPTVLWISLMWSCSVSRHTEHQRLPTSLCGSKPFYFVWNMSWVNRSIVPPTYLCLWCRAEKQATFLQEETGKINLALGGEFSLVR